MDRLINYKDGAAAHWGLPTLQPPHSWKHDLLAPEWMFLTFVADLALLTWVGAHKIMDAPHV